MLPARDSGVNAWEEYGAGAEAGMYEAGLGTTSRRRVSRNVGVCAATMGKMEECASYVRTMPPFPAGSRSKKCTRVRGASTVDSSMKNRGVTSRGEENNRVWSRYAGLLHLDDMIVPQRVDGIAFRCFLSRFFLLWSLAIDITSYYKCRRKRIPGHTPQVERRKHWTRDDRVILSAVLHPATI
ncbi:hypothetical protein K438DRAFT_1775625 [Mycena galopus ATCC 62051]|nr:hypothetical protein K438DRAFT_1775625 [Mycena galopus ATCC 62051]